MRKLTKTELSTLKRNGNTGALSRIRVADKFDLAGCEIRETLFKGTNTLNSGVHLIRSIVSDTLIDSESWVLTSTVVKSMLGQCTVIKNKSVVKDTVCSPIVVPVHQRDKSVRNTLFYVLINNSHVEGDMVFGGTDMRKTKSRGGSVFAFSHIGEGEFTKNVMLGTQPDGYSAKKLICVPHFGYYGKMMMLALAAYKEDKVPDVDSEKLMDAYEASYIHRYFGGRLPKGISYETGRMNIGSGGSMSDYDPIKDTKAGAIMLLANAGVNVTYSPFLTVMYHSLIANGSIDVISAVEDGVVPPGTLVGGAREKRFVQERHYLKHERRIMSSRCDAEVRFVVRYLRMLGALAKVARKGYRSRKGFERLGWKRFADTLTSTAMSVSRRWLHAYFKILELNSLPGLKARIKKDKKKELKERLKVQEALLKKKREYLKQGDTALALISKIDRTMAEPAVEELFKRAGDKAHVVSTTEQRHQLGVSLIKLPEEVTA
jgi:hypothetical protein